MEKVTRTDGGLKVTLQHFSELNIKTFIVLLICLATWTFPVKVAAAKQANVEESIFINYGQFHKTILQSNEASNKADEKVFPKKSNRPINNQVSSFSEYSGRNYSKEEVRELIIAYSKSYGISPETPLCIAQKESGFNQFSRNRTSSASGVFQYLNSTWSSTDEGKAGFSIWDAEANIKAAIKYMASRKNTNPWTVGKSCPQL